MAVARDEVWSGLTALLFGTASGALSLIVPFLLLRAGESHLIVGLIATLAGLSQLVTRFSIPALMRAIPDRAVVLLSTLLLTAALVLAVFTRAIGLIVLIQLLHGSVRALFWTGLQTHSVRSGRTAVRGLAGVNLFAGLGLMLGPALFGALVAIAEFFTATSTALVAAALAAFASGRLARYAPFGPAKGIIARAAWTGPTLLGSWMSALAGVWRGLLDTYIPVLLIALAFSEAEASGLVALSSGSILIGTLLAARTRTSRNRLLYVVAVVCASAIMFAMPHTENLWLPLAAMMLLGGLISGGFQTYGTALAADSVPSELKGDVITITGIFRSLAILGLPGLMTVLVTALPLSTVFSVAGGGLLMTSLGAYGKKGECTDDR